VNADLDTLLTALHVELTDRIIPPLGIGRRDIRPQFPYDYGTPQAAVVDRIFE
jgi:hypothetical protein